MSKLGMGVMISRLSGNGETVTAVQSSIGKTISSVEMKNDTLRIDVGDGVLVLQDAGQSCCEKRYMTCGDLDNADYYKGATITDIEVREAPDVMDSAEEHEVQFLFVTTSKGVITCETHNEHNGYYGGFAIEARLDMKS